jgi:enediyne polyketide synthase
MEASKNMRETRIAIVGIGLRYPDASSPDELWENVLAGRRAFRRLPDERMNGADYWSADPAAPDRHYTRMAAVLRDFEFDRVRYRVAGSTFRATDLTHWLALDVATRALDDAGFPGGDGLPGPATGVVIGNSLTGEFSRANLMRLRWPYVRRTVAAALGAKGWADAETAAFLRELEVRYKAPFPPIDEDSLAGGLANTIAGRICNYFDLAGGGYTVDGACSSSLLAVATAAKALADGDLDVMLAGGVDLSIDPFEVIGFAKTGALATGEMKVYDAGSNGFWPGEGSGVVVLMRERDALDQGRRVYATITGWGISSDGKGGITRPEAAGHRLAIERAYRRAGYGVQTVSYFEGHGTGTALGDATEIEALSTTRREADPAAPPAALGTVKGNFGHTKAAAGVAGLIKAALAVHHQVIPPGTGHYDPHPKLTEPGAAMYVPGQAEPWPTTAPIRAGVSAMGFGGINTHIAVEQAPGIERRTALAQRTSTLVAGRQDAELLLVDAPDRAGLRERVTWLGHVVPRLSYAELADLANTLAEEVSGRPARAAVVVTGPEDATRKLARLLAMLDSGQDTVFAPGDGIFAGRPGTPPRVAFLFPGQGSGRGATGALRRRFTVVADVFHAARIPATGDQVATEVAQPRIVAGSLAALRVLHSLGVTASTAVGHSLGELTALSWGGAMGGTQLLALAADRGRIMAAASRGGGTMASLATDPVTARRLANGLGVVLAGYNGPGQTVVSGPIEAVELVCKKALAEGITATRVNVSHAFHSPLVTPAADAMTERLAEMSFARLMGKVFSTVTGAALAADADLRALLREQVLKPVRFHEAAAKAVAGADLALEVGPGRVLTGLLNQISPETPAISTDTDSPSLAPLLTALGAAHAAGVTLNTDVLFAGRGVRPLPLDAEPTFLASPCETAPDLSAGLAETVEAAPAVPPPDTGTTHTSTLELLRTLAAERVELPLDAVGPDTHPLDDLHLSSITVGQIVGEVTRQLGRAPLTATPNFATVRLGELAMIIDEQVAASDSEPAPAAGVAAWVRPFTVEYTEQERPVPPARTGTARADWTVFAPDGHPLAEPLRAALATAGAGAGVLLCLPASGETHIGEFVRAARAVVAGTRLVVVQGRLGAAGLARTVRLEAPAVPVTVVELADVVPTADEAVRTAVRRVVAEVAATTDFAEVRYDGDGTRTVPVLRPCTARDSGSALDASDVLLITGGGKGITAECALAVAVDSGARLALLGRADPTTDTELAANLARMTAAGVRFRYERADVTDADQVRAAVARIAADLGPVTAVLHGAGRNEPSALGSLTEERYHETLAPKITGLRSVLGAVDADRIRLLVTFGSIIGRAGLAGEAHYATANDWLTELTVRFGAEHPKARVLALEWSVWSGAGMGERLGVVEALARQGVMPISTDAGVAVLRQVLADPDAGPVLVVSGRTGDLPTVTLDRPALPLLRFVDRVLVHYPGIELVTESDLSEGGDPYLADHQLDGDLLFPAVLGMEAMTQVAAAVTGATGRPVLENLEFSRPVVVRPGGSTKIRIAALHTGGGVVDVVVRSAETGFGADHFRATVRWPRPELTTPANIVPVTLPTMPVRPAELYGGMLFQGKRFQRLAAYRRASARHAVADLAAGPQPGWFAAFLPQDLLLADPGTRDAAMHAIQCCVPDAILLPERVDRLYLTTEGWEPEHVVLDARERRQDGDSYTYDVDIIDPAGVLLERWEGLTLRAVRRTGGAGPWVSAMLGSYLERALERVLGTSPAVAVEPAPGAGTSGGSTPRRVRTEFAVSRALGRRATLRYRPDGRPETDGATVSAAHGAGLTLAVAGAGRLSCDVEPVVERTAADWATLLGSLPARDLLRRTEPAEVANTRIWAALECLRKAGATTESLTVDTAQPDRWVVLSAGDASIATWVTRVNRWPDPVVFAVLVGKDRR